MKVKSSLSSLLKVLSTIFLFTVLLSPVSVDASCPNRGQLYRPRLHHRRLRHHHYPMQYYYPSYGQGSSFGTLMNEIFTMPIYLNSLMRQHDEQVSHLLHHSAAPQYEITEADGAFELALDVPGARPEDLNIQLEEGGAILRVSGSRHHRKGNGELVSYEFDQTFTMDDNVDVDEISVSLSDGILRIIAPKVTKAREDTRKLPIEYKEEEETAAKEPEGGNKEESINAGEEDGSKKTKDEEIQHNEGVEEEVEKKEGVEEVDGLTITDDEE